MSHHDHRLTLSPQSPSTWQAFLNLRYGKTQRGTRLVEKRHQGPLYTQKAFYPEGKDLAHTYLLHPPGGLVSGDELTITVDVDEAAQCLITTPGAGRVYKARADKALQSQKTQLRLAEGASCEWLPQETIIYPDAHGELSVAIDLAPGAKTLGWEVACYGLPASDELFEQGSINQQLLIRQEGLPLLVDTQRLDASDTDFYHGAAGLASSTCSGLMWAGPFENYPETLLEQLNERCNQHPLAACSFTRGFITVRYLGHNAMAARALFQSCWQRVRPALIGRESCYPAIWDC